MLRVWSSCTYPTLTPMSWLHTPDPFVNVLACPVCPKPSCNMGARQNIQTIMSEIAGSPAGTDEHDKAEKVKGEVMPCNVCEKVDKTFKCARCKIAFYCGKERQAQDWPSHKRACKSIASGH
ncbi:hypothetical protein DL95DRAFT_394976 [Leptodontidium sp. 2 PMI_412]|nr:hypothetical protein DL95DRAFT_394976 [Leptodontidium sp. 2 PMI_412]